MILPSELASDCGGHLCGMQTAGRVAEGSVQLSCVDFALFPCNQGASSSPCGFFTWSLCVIFPTG